MSDSAGNTSGRAESIHAMLHPKSVAIVGATERLQYGGRFLHNLLTTGCSARLYLVNPRRDEILGKHCYRSILELPEPVDLAAIIIPAHAVLDAVRQCIEIGVKSGLVISAGFTELGTEEGRARQTELRALARQSGMRICGPNCLGLANVAESTWASAGGQLTAETVALYSEIGLISQSGATGFGPLITTARDRGVGFRYIVSTGNEADLDASDFIQYMLNDPEVRVVAALVEGFRDGVKFVKAADRALEMGKPLVLLKVGRSPAGAKAAGSHTAAMTGSDVVQDALFRQKGVVRVDDYDELIETANMFLKARAPRGERVGIVSHSGGIGSFLADKCGESGLELPVLSDQTRDRLGGILGERGSSANPADVTGFAFRDDFPQILDALLADEHLDLQVIASGGGDLQANTVIQASQQSAKPIFFLWTGSIKDTGSLSKLQASAVPVFYLPGRIAKGIRRLFDYHRVRREATTACPEANKTDLSALPEALGFIRAVTSAAAGTALNESESKQVLALSGVSVTRERLCTSLGAALAAGAEIGYPVALKVVSRDIPHKTEAGGVQLDLAGPRELSEAYEEVLSTVRDRRPGARLDGILVQQMVPGGVEVVVGISRDEQFGPVLMLGLGGVLVEAIGAASWRVCPVTRFDAEAMIEEVRGLSRIMEGFRGRPRADRIALVDALIAVSRLAIAGKEDIEFLDINPLSVLAEGKGTVALDALIIPPHSAVPSERGDPPCG